MSNLFWKKRKKKLIRKKSYADRPYLIFLAMLVETKNFFLRLTDDIAHKIKNSLQNKFKLDPYHFDS